MRILFLTTKLPWPPVDGGRVLVLNTLAGLAARGHEITLLSPSALSPEGESRAREALGPLARLELVPVASRTLVGTSLVAALRRLPFSIARHRRAAVLRRLATLLESERFDLVHVEQLQALAQAEPAFARSVPVVLRAENVESDVWAATAGVHRTASWWLRREAKRLSSWEGQAVARVAATAALTHRDAERLARLADGRGRVEVVRAPFPAELPRGSGTLEGRPAIVLFGSAGWLPNGDAERWFLREAWPALLAALPEARLHRFGREARERSMAGVIDHSSPADSGEAYAPGSILVVPLRIASGVRIRILEAWAREVPVVATPEAVAGLDAEAGRQLLVGRSAEELVAAFRRLVEEPGLAPALVAEGHAALKRWHDPATCAAELEALYRRAAEPGGARRDL
ncbi:MAG: glycosyltransferase family 4 protein [Thermoanaerobaculia bacterium]